MGCGSSKSGNSSQMTARGDAAMKSKSGPSFKRKAADRSMIRQSLSKINVGMSEEVRKCIS